MEASQTRLSVLEGELARLEKARVERQSLREAVKAAEVQIASKEKQREENARFLERAWHRWKPQGRSMSKERCDWRGRMRNLRACDWNCNRPGNWTCNWNRP